MSLYGCLRACLIILIIILLHLFRASTHGNSSSISPRKHRCCEFHTLLFAVRSITGADRLKTCQQNIMINCRRILNVHMLVAHKTFGFLFFCTPNMGMAEDEGWEEVAEIGRENGRLIRVQTSTFI